MIIMDILTNWIYDDDIIVHIIGYMFKYITDDIITCIWLVKSTIILFVI